MAALLNSRFQVHVLGGTPATLRLPAPFKLAEQLFAVLSPTGGEVCLLQALDRQGYPVLLVQLSSAQAMGLDLGNTTLLSNDVLRRAYEVFSPVVFTSTRDLKRRLSFLRRQQGQGQRVQLELASIFGRYEYERGRLYKTLVLDKLECDKYFFDWDPLSFQSLARLPLASLYATISEDGDCLLDVGVAFGRIRPTEDGEQVVEPVPSATVRFKNGSCACKQLQDLEKISPAQGEPVRANNNPCLCKKRQNLEEAEYPVEAAQSEIAKQAIIGEGVARVLQNPPFELNGTCPALILLVDDEEKTVEWLHILGVQVGNVRRGFVDLFRSVSKGSPSTSFSTRGKALPPNLSGAKPSSSKTSRRSESPTCSPITRTDTRGYVYPSPALSPQRALQELTVYVVDIRAMYTAATKTWDDGRWSAPQMARGTGLQMSASEFWNGAAYAELLIEIFGRLIQGDAIDGKDVVHVERLPQPSSVHPVCFVPEEGMFDFSDDDSGA
ncbi:hypothetical protein V5O48_007249 [Marasmius crinis-equi]|uniref:Uncharacterized protein n=1 Tax=Marasmius crinis-equi TaxID=585013 RepID=A0ABR3FHQ3_9AGAR